MDATLMRKAREHGVPYNALLQVYQRGSGAWRTNLGSVRLRGSYAKDTDTAAHPRSARLGREQWAMARVNAFLEKRPTVFYGADDDIRRKFHLS
jgi:hypothetical protein